MFLGSITYHFQSFLKRLTLLTQIIVILIFDLTSFSIQFGMVDDEFEPSLKGKGGMGIF